LKPVKLHNFVKRTGSRKEGGNFFSVSKRRTKIVFDLSWKKIQTIYRYIKNEISKVLNEKKGPEKLFLHSTGIVFDRRPNFPATLARWQCNNLATVQMG
jgi:hypothetical protein